jgi:hypothetical protein
MKAIATAAVLVAFALPCASQTVAQPRSDAPAQAAATETMWRMETSGLGG